MHSPTVENPEAKGVPSVVVTEPTDNESPTDPTALKKFVNTAQKAAGSRPKKLRAQPKSDVSADVGYTSSSTLAPLDSFRGRTSTESSDSSVYYSANGSSDPSPTNSGDVPPVFPVPATPPNKPSDKELLKSINEGLARLSEHAKSLEKSIDRLSARVGCIEEKIEHLRPRAISAETQTTEMRTCKSLPDISIVSLYIHA